MENQQPNVPSVAQNTRSKGQVQVQQSIDEHAAQHQSAQQQPAQQQTAPAEFNVQSAFQFLANEIREMRAESNADREEQRSIRAENNAQMAAFAQSMQTANQRLHRVEARTDQVTTEVTQVKNELSSLRTELSTLRDSMVFAERDHRRLLIGEPGTNRMTDFLTAKGDAAVRALLRTWAASYRAATPSAYDWDEELAHCGIWRAEQFLGGRIYVQVKSKLARDELCRQLALSPSRKSTWPSLRVQARLTSHQESNRRLVLGSFQVPVATNDDTTLNRPFLPGRRVQFSADVANVITDGHGAQQINLGLGIDRVQARIAAIKALTPGAPENTGQPSHAPVQEALPPPPADVAFPLPRPLEQADQDMA